MSMKETNRQSVVRSLACALVVSVAFTALPVVYADHGRGMGEAGHGMRHHPTQCEHAGGADHHVRHGHHAGWAESRLMGVHWLSTLTDDQKLHLDRLQVEYAKEKTPLKMAQKAVRLELAVLVTQDAPDVQAVNDKVNELLDLERAKLLSKSQYIAAQRKVLTPEQRVSFDMDVLQRAKYGKIKREGR